MILQFDPYLVFGIFLYTFLTPGCKRYVMQQYLAYLCIDINETGPSLVIFLRVDQFYVLRLLAHLSRSLIGELIVYQWSGVRPSSSSVVVRRPQCSNIFFSETAWPIKAKFYVEPPWVGGTKFCSRHLGHMTKMAATPIYGKNPSKIFFSRTGRPISTKLGM